jgi:hypothetical protein
MPRGHRLFMDCTILGQGWCLEAPVPLFLRAYKISFYRLHCRSSLRPFYVDIPFESGGRFHESDGEDETTDVARMQQQTVCMGSERPGYHVHRAPSVVGRDNSSDANVGSTGRYGYLQKHSPKEKDPPRRKKRRNSCPIVTHSACWIIAQVLLQLPHICKGWAIKLAPAPRPSTIYCATLSCTIVILQLPVFRLVETFGIDVRQSIFLTQQNIDRVFLHPECPIIKLFISSSFFCFCFSFGKRILNPSPFTHFIINELHV